MQSTAGKIEDICNHTTTIKYKCTACQHENTLHVYKEDKKQLYSTVEYTDCDCGRIEIYNSPAAFTVEDKAVREVLQISDSGLIFKWHPGQHPYVEDAVSEGKIMPLTRVCAQRIIESKLIVVKNEDALIVSAH